MHYKYKRNKTIVSGLHGEIQVDLADVSNIAKDNHGTRFLLVCINVFSKVAALEPLKSKSGIEVAKAMDKVLKHSQYLTFYVVSYSWS